MGKVATLKVDSAERIRMDRYHGSTVMYLWRITFHSSDGGKATELYWSYSDYTTLTGKTITILEEAMFEVNEEGAE